MSVIQLSDVHRAYEAGKDAVNGVSFSVKPGEVLGLLGKNGAGKTTLIRVAMGLLEPDSGTVRLFGLDPREHPIQVKRRVGYVSEDQILPSFMRIEQVLEMHRALFPDWDDDTARSLVDRFSLAPRAKVGSLSKGQARQVALVCAIAHKPELLLLDEPAGGLDAAARREFLETSIQLLNEAGTTILFSSHHLTDVERMAGRVVLMHEGRVLVDSELDGLQEQYSIALVPFSNGNAESLRTRLAAQPGCVAVRERSDAMHAVFRLAPASAEALLSRDMGVSGARCRTAGLEEMFIELVEGQS